MVGGDNLDFLAEHVAAKILDRHLGGLNGIFAAVIGIDTGLIIQDADLDALRQRRQGEQEAASHQGRRQASRFHIGLPQNSVGGEDEENS
jgi:hypothetical protein